MEKRERIELTIDEFVILYNSIFKEDYEYCGCNITSKRIRLQKYTNKIIKINK